MSEQELAQDRAEVTATIREEGAPFQLKRTAGTYNSKSSRTEQGGTATYNTYAADWEYELKDIDGTLIRQGDVRLIVAAEDANGAVIPDPVPGDVGVYAGECLKVITNQVTRKAGVAMMHVLQLRR